MVGIKKVAGLPAMLVVIIGVASVGCTRSPQAKEAKFLKRGNTYLEEKDYQRAIIEFRNATNVNANDAEAFYRLALAYWSAGRFNEAYIALRKAADLNPNHARVQGKLAELMATSRDEKMAVEAKQHAEQAAHLAPRDPDSLYALALTQYRLGEAAKAEAQLAKTLAQFPNNLRSAVGLATLYLERKDFHAAEEVLQKAANQQPESAEAILALASAYEMDGKAIQAESEYRRVLRVDPKNGLALSSIGNLQLRSGRKREAEQTFRQVSELTDKTYEASYAFFLMDQGRVHEAIGDFQRLAKKDPADRLARSRLITAYLTQNKLDEAQKILAKALKANAKDTAALFQRSEIYIRLRRYTEAEQDLTEVLHSTPDRAEAHYLLSEIHRARGASLLQRQELNEALRYKPDLLEARIAFAYALVLSKKSKEALTVLDQAPDYEKQITAFITARNWALVASHNSTEARKGVETGLTQSKTPELLLQDALLKIQEKDYDHARASLESILKADPANTPALKILAQTYIDQKLPATASQKVREYAAMQPGSHALQVFAADWFLKHGNPTDAATAIGAARAADPHGAAPDLVQAQLYWGQGKLNSARSRLASVLAADEQNVGAHVLLAMIEESSGNYSQAVVHYRRVVELNPTHAVALNGLAYRLGNDTTELDEALKLAQQAKELAPTSPAVDDTLGWILFRKGHYRAARDYLERASTNSPDPVIKYHLAMACFKLGELSRGRQVLLSALQANAKLPEAAQAQALLSAFSNSR
jgi:putative PEP-CTERM system TPR-repeat lipoprotein